MGKKKYLYYIEQEGPSTDRIRMNVPSTRGLGNYRTYHRISRNVPQNKNGRTIDLGDFME